MKTFEVNGKEYNAKPFTFNTVCDLEDMGVSMGDIQRKPMSMVRAYFAICSGRGAQFAGQEMEKHIISGGDFTKIMEITSNEMNASDFFRSLNKKEETEDAEGETEEAEVAAEKPKKK